VTFLAPAVHLRFTHCRLPLAMMSALNFIAAGMLLVASPMPASAAPRLHCLSRNEQRAAIASGAVVTLARARRSLRQRGIKGELVRARLCRTTHHHLIYLLTLLPRDGRVRRATINAATGKLVHVR
jgi:hypothetical protein